MKPRLILEFETDAAKEEFIGQLLDGWGEGLYDYIQPELTCGEWIVDGGNENESF
jgi:hypothetical protein